MRVEPKDDHSPPSRPKGFPGRIRMAHQTNPANDSRLGLLGFVAFSIVYLGSTLWWLLENTLPFAWDQSWYLETSQRLLWEIQGGRPVGFLQTLVGAFGGTKAPLMSLLPLPFYLTLGNTNAAIIATLLAITAVGLIFLFLLGKELFGSAQAAVAVVIVGFMPLTFGLARDFLVDFGLMALVALWIYLALRSNFFQRRRICLAVGVATGLGLLMKLSFPLFIVGPLTIILLQRWRTAGFNLFAWSRDGLVVLGGSLLVAGVWYIPNAKKVLGFATSSTFGSISQDYSDGDPLAPAVILRYWQEILNHGTSVFLGALLMTLLAVALYRRRTDAGRLKSSCDRPAPAALLISWFLIPFVVTSLAVNKDHRYLLPALPAVGFAISALLFYIVRSTRFRIATVSVVLISSFVLFVNASVRSPFALNWSINGWMIVSPQHQFASRPLDQPWPLDQIVLAIAADATRSGAFRNRAGEFVAIIPDHRRFNQNSFAFRSAFHRLPFTFGHSYTSSEDSTLALRRLELSDYVVTKTGDQGPEFLTLLSDDLNNMLMAGELPFREHRRWRLPDESAAILYARVPLAQAGNP